MIVEDLLSLSKATPVRDQTWGESAYGLLAGKHKVPEGIEEPTGEDFINTLSQTEEGSALLKQEVVVRKDIGGVTVVLRKGERLKNFIAGGLTMAVILGAYVYFTGASLFDVVVKLAFSLL